MDIVVSQKLIMICIDLYMDYKYIVCYIGYKYKVCYITCYILTETEP